MPKNWRQGLYWLALALAVCTPIYAMLTSANYANCAQHQGQYPTKDNNYNKSPAVLVPPAGDVRIFWRCTGGYASENGNAITAASTFLLLIVTGLLGWIAYRQYTTTRSQLRAYMFVDEASMFDGPTWPQAPVPVASGCPNSVIWIKNFGQTPAFNVRHWSNVTFSPVNHDGVVPVTNIYIPDGQVRALGATTIGPGARTNVMRNLGRAVTQFEINALANPGHGHGLLVYGRIIYEDAFGKEHTTDYCLGWSGTYPVQMSATLIAMASGNRAT